MVMNSIQKTVKKAEARFTASSFEITRNKGFVEGDFDIFDMLAYQKKERAALESSLNTTIALLERSTEMLHSAENTINTLQSATLVDDISGLLNRRGFFQIFKKEFARMHRKKSEGGLLVVFNLENLKVIREQYGKKAANRAIKLLTKAFEQEIRETDYAGRIMDDEFVLLFMDTNMNEALSRLQNMALRLNKLSLIWEGQEINLNLSLGLKSFTAQDHEAAKIFEAASIDLERNRKGQTHKKSA